MQIAICDDMKDFREQLKSIIIKYKIEHSLYIDVYEFNSGEDLIKSKDTFDLIFLDYQMSGLDGLEVAKTLRGKNINCSIVFVTSYPEFVFDSFEVSPYRFLVKPINEETIRSLISNFIAKEKQLSPIIVINDNEKKVIAVKDVLYLEGDGKKCIIRTTLGTYHSSKTLAQVHKLLPQHYFYRAHKSYVVNMAAINSFEKDKIILINGEMVQLGINKTSEFKKSFMQFIRTEYLRV